MFKKKPNSQHGKAGVPLTEPRALSTVANSSSAPLVVDHPAVHGHWLLPVF